jgi:hypothetical protein
MARGTRTRNSAAVMIVHYVDRCGTLGDVSAGHDAWLSTALAVERRTWCVCWPGRAACRRYFVPSPTPVLPVGGGDN